MKIPLADPLIGEEEEKEVLEVVRSGWIREGEKAREFEKEFAKYLGIKHAIVTSSGTAALHVALACLNVKKGDEVIMPSFTCIPPVSMTLLSGGVPVFVDIEGETYNLNPEKVETMISEKTKVIIPINYAGHPAELDTLQEIVKRHGIYLLNDVAEALGAMYKSKKVSDFGDVSVFSFSPNKTITTGEGGMLVTNNEEIAEKARIIKDYGQKPRFHYVEQGYNYHVTELQAAMGLAQLGKIERILELKRRNAKLLTNLISEINGIIPPIEKPDCIHAYCLYSIRVISTINRNRLMKKLERSGIQTRVYFPPVHRSPLMKKIKYEVNDLGKTENVASTILSLPISPKLTENEIEYVHKIIKEAVKVE